MHEILDLIDRIEDRHADHRMTGTRLLRERATHDDAVRLRNLLRDWLRDHGHD
jgi:hypothetical protein